MISIGVDTGGTFTDFIYRSGARTGTYKTLSTPHNPSEAVLRGLTHIVATLGLGETVDSCGLAIIHGSTVATNAILERKGVPTALVTNEGFTDVIEIGRQNRTRLYDLAYARDPHIVPPTLRFGVPGRVDSDGRIIEDLDEDAPLRETVARIRETGAQSVAVCLLFSFLRPGARKAGGRTPGRTRPAGLPVPRNPGGIPRIRADLDHGGQRLRLADHDPLPARTSRRPPRATPSRSCSPTAGPSRRTRPCVSPCAPSSPARRAARWARWNWAERPGSTGSSLLTWAAPARTSASWTAGCP